MPDYNATSPAGRAELFVRPAENSPFTPSYQPGDPIGDLLEQVAGDVEGESSPERRRAESRLADRRLIEQVRFEMTLDRKWDGLAYHQLFDDLWLYSLPVIKAFLKRNAMTRVHERYTGRAFTMRSEDMVVLANSDDERTELALDIIARAVENFRAKAVTPGKHQWNASMRGASMRTYFIGACALVYPRVYGKWSKTRKGKLELLASQHDINLDSIGEIIAHDLAAVVGVRVDLQRIIDVATPTTKLILGMLLNDMTQVQIAAELGLTVKAVNRRLAHFRQRAYNPTRPPLGRRPVGSTSKAAA